MTVFSERNGYITPSSVLIREDMPEEIKNAICTGYDLLLQAMLPGHGLSYEEMEKYSFS